VLIQPILSAKPMKILVSFFLLFSALSIQAQKVTGYWYGKANVEVAGIQNNYLTELIISQKGNKVKGFFGYYFKDVYQSFVVKGSFDPNTKKLIINDIPIIFYQTNSTTNSVDCITSFYGTLRVSKVKTELNGYFYRDKKYTYTCPDLRVNYTLFTEAKVTDSIFKDMTSIRSFWKPQPPVPDVVMGNNAQSEKEMQASPDEVAGVKSTSRETESSTTQKNSSASSVNAETTAAPKTVSGSSTSSTTTRKSPASVTETAPGAENKPGTMLAEQTIVQADIIKINQDFRKRKQIVSKQIEVSSDSVRLSFYDNAEVDGDSISVFLNGKLVIAHQELSERAFNVYVQLDTNLETNEVSMFAENLGKYPPNTALMVISDGDKRYETFLSSDFKGNATIRLKLRRNSVAGN
jgi:hypothetical protein